MKSNATHAAKEFRDRAKAKVSRFASLLLAREDLSLAEVADALAIHPSLVQDRCSDRKRANWSVHDVILLGHLSSSAARKFWQWLGHELGVDEDGDHHGEDHLARLACVIEKGGDVGAFYAQSIADGDLSDDELAELSKKVRAAVKAFDGLEHAINAEQKSRTDGREASVN